MWSVAGSTILATKFFLSCRQLLKWTNYSHCVCNVHKYYIWKLECCRSTWLDLWTSFRLLHEKRCGAKITKVGLQRLPPEICQGHMSCANILVHKSSTPSLSIKCDFSVLCRVHSPFPRLGHSQYKGPTMKKNPVYKNQGWEPIHQKFKANESMSRHNPNESQQLMKNKEKKILCKFDPRLRNDDQWLKKKM
jgi:hypothetical protein